MLNCCFHKKSKTSQNQKHLTLVNSFIKHSMLDQLVSLCNPSEFDETVSVCALCVWWCSCNYRVCAFDASCWWRGGRLWQGDVCVYHVRLCSSSQTINHSVFLCILYRKNMSLYDFECAYMTLRACWNASVCVLAWWRECVSICIKVYVCGVWVWQRQRQKQTTKKSRGREVKRNLFYCLLLFIYLFTYFRSELSYSLITLSVCSQGPALWYHLGGRAILYSSWSSEGSFAEEEVPPGRP